MSHRLKNNWIHLLAFKKIIAAISKMITSFPTLYEWQPFNEDSGYPDGMPRAFY